jgi:hypothetical protein
MPDTYSPADEPRKIGYELIKKHHDHLSGRRVEFLFVERKDKDGNSQAITRRGKNLYGQAKLVTGLNAYLGTHDLDELQPFFVILIIKHFWTNASDLFKQALVDHELCHCEYDSETDKYSTVDHDVTEFTQIVKRHGLWNPGVEAFVKSAKQQSLAFDSEVKEGPADGVVKTPVEVPLGSVGVLNGTPRTPKVRRIRGARTKEQANKLLGPITG